MILKAWHQKPLTERQEERMNELIHRYNHTPGPGSPGIPYRRADGTEVEFYFNVSDDEATRAASEFRACGFVTKLRDV